MTLHSTLPKQPLAPSVVALGCFDGVHLGHRAVILRAVRWAKELGLSSTVFVFESSPKNYFAPNSVPQLTDRETKIALLEVLGVDTVVCVPFDQTIATTSAEDFFHQILCTSLGAKHIVCGYNYSFGAKGAGNTALLGYLRQRQVFVIVQIKALALFIRKQLAVKIKQHALHKPLVFHGLPPVKLISFTEYTV